MPFINGFLVPDVLRMPEQAPLLNFYSGAGKARVCQRTPKCTLSITIQRQRRIHSRSRSCDIICSFVALVPVSVKSDRRRM